MSGTFDDHSFHIRRDEARLLNQKLSGRLLPVKTNMGIKSLVFENCSKSLAS